MATMSSSSHKREKRGKVTGWSSGAARRNVAFLRSVDERHLTGHGIAVTLTIRNCPDSIDAWRKLLNHWIIRQRRRGMLRIHWVMEFQRRGCPHLHCAIWYDDSSGFLDDFGAGAVQDWLDLAAFCGAGPKGQQWRPIEGAVGWFQYLAKHCGRGKQHYQRQQESLPAAWDSSPRVWGHCGSWTLVEPAEGQLTTNQWYRLRRLVRSMRVSRARCAVPGPGWDWPRWIEGLTRREARDLPIPPRILGKAGTPLRVRLRHLVQARAMLKCGNRKLSEVRGISEWITETQQQALLRGISR